VKHPDGIRQQTLVRPYARAQWKITGVNRPVVSGSSIMLAAEMGPPQLTLRPRCCIALRRSNVKRERRRSWIMTASWPTVPQEYRIRAIPRNQGTRLRDTRFDITGDGENLVFEFFSSDLLTPYPPGGHLEVFGSHPGFEGPPSSRVPAPVFTDKY
jgi:hypothetical protein